MNKIVVSESGIRLDKYLLDKLEITRNQIIKMIDNGQVYVNDKKVKKSYVTKINDIITYEEYQEDNNIEQENIPLDIVYEDDDLLVVNKPSGMVVHPAAGNYHHTLVNALLYHCHNLSDINGEVRPGIVHRIDADTSGLLVVAKNNETHNALAKQISEKTVTREYIALVEGVIAEDTATIDAPIGRSNTDRKKMSVTDINSKDAITHLRVLARYKRATLISCRLETGRTHQIRVHLSYINHPVINDPVYNAKKVFDKDFGQMLHARKLGFIHPKTQKYMEFTCEEPERFKEIVSMYQHEE